MKRLFDPSNGEKDSFRRPTLDINLDFIGNISTFQAVNIVKIVSFKAKINDNFQSEYVIFP